MHCNIIVQNQIQPSNAHYPLQSSESSISDYSSERQNVPLHHLAFIKSLTHETLYAASNPVYLSGLDSLTKKDQEISLLKDQIVNLQYVLNSTTAYMLTILFRNRLIQTLTAPPPSTVPFANLNPNPTASTLDLALLRQSNYPNVKHWVRKRGDDSQVSVIKMTDADSMSDDGENDDSSEDDAGVLAFLENEDGTLISQDGKRRLYGAMHGFWNDQIDRSDPPMNWSSAGETLRNSFRNFLKTKFFYLRLCANHWKAEELWKQNYHSWRQSCLHRTTDTSLKQHKRKRMDNKAITRMKKAKMKAWAISVDSDTPDSDKFDPTDEATNETHTINDSKQKADKVFTFSSLQIDHITQINATLAKGSEYRYHQCTSLALAEPHFRLLTTLRKPQHSLQNAPKVSRNHSLDIAKLIFAQKSQNPL